MADRRGEDEIEMGGPLAFLAFCEMIRPGSIFKSTNSLQASYEILGELDTNLLSEALSDVGRENAILWGAVIERDGAFHLRLNPPGDLHVEEHSQPPGYRLPSGLAGLVPVDAREAPVIRAVLHQVDREHFYLRLAIHEIAADSWSMGLYANRLFTAYRLRVTDGHNATRAPDASPYLDLIHRGSGDVAADGEAAQFWKAYLEGIPRMHYPTDRGRDESELSKLARIFRPLNNIDRSAVALNRSRYRTTPFILFLGAWVLEMAGRTGLDDIVIPTLWAGRTESGFQNVPGPMTNALILRPRIDRVGTIQSFIRSLTKDVLSAYRYSFTPIDRVAEQVPAAVEILADPAHIRMIFQFVPFKPLEVTIPGLEIREISEEEVYGDASEEEDAFPSDYRISIIETVEAIMLDIAYETGMFEEATIRAAADRYELLLAGILRNGDATVDALLQSVAELS